MRYVLSALIAIALIVLLCAAWMGAFRSVAVTEEDRGPFTLVYMSIAPGQLDQVGPITDQLDAALTAAGISQRKPLDLFQPDGSGDVGFAVEGATADQLANLPSKASSRVIPAQRVMVATFPWRNRGSYMLGYIKVDRALADYRAAHGYKKVEAMSLLDGATIVYMQPVVK